MTQANLQIFLLFTSQISTTKSQNKNQPKTQRKNPQKQPSIAVGTRRNGRKRWDTGRDGGDVTSRVEPQPAGKSSSESKKQTEPQRTKNGVVFPQVSAGVRACTCMYLLVLPCTSVYFCVRNLQTI